MNLQYLKHIEHHYLTTKFQTLTGNEKSNLWWTVIYKYNVKKDLKIVGLKCKDWVCWWFQPVTTWSPLGQFHGVSTEDISSQATGQPWTSSLFMRYFPFGPSTPVMLKNSLTIFCLYSILLKVFEREMLIRILYSSLNNKWIHALLLSYLQVF